MQTITYSPIAQNNITTLQNLSGGGDVFVFLEEGLDIVEQINSGGVYMTIKDSCREGSVKVVSLNNGIILARDSDRKVVKLNCELKVSLLSPKI